MQEENAPLPNETAEGCIVERSTTAPARILAHHKQGTA
jgi:hypothetical protein